MAKLMINPYIRSFVAWKETPSTTAGCDYDLCFKLALFTYNNSDGHKLPFHVRFATSGISTSAYGSTTDRLQVLWSPVWDINGTTDMAGERYYHSGYNGPGYGESYSDQVKMACKSTDAVYIPASNAIASCMFLWDNEWNLIDYMVYNEADKMSVHVDSTQNRLYDSHSDQVNLTERSITITNLDVIEPDPHTMPLAAGYWWVNPSDNVTFNSQNFGRGFTAVYWEPRDSYVTTDPLVDTTIVKQFKNTWQDFPMQAGSFHIYEYVLNNQWYIPDHDTWGERPVNDIRKPGDMLLGVAGNNNTYLLTDTSYLAAGRPRIFNGILECPRVRGKNCWVFPISSNAINLQNNDGTRQWFLVHTVIDVIVRQRHSTERGMWIMPEPLGMNYYGMGNYPCFLAEPWTRVSPDFSATSTIPAYGQWCGNDGTQYGTRYMQQTKRQDSMYNDPIQMIQAHYAVNPAIFQTQAAARPTGFQPISGPSYTNCAPTKFTPEISARLLNGLWFKFDSNWVTADGTDYSNTAAAQWTNKFFTGYNIYP